MRIRIFVDFWNFQLAWNKYHRNSSTIVRISWDTTFVPVICNSIDRNTHYRGAHIFASVDPNNRNDDKLKLFLSNTMDRFSGFSVTIKERKPDSNVRCPSCRQEIIACPHCKQSLKRTIEKGVDTALVTALITMSLDGLHDRAVLISADADMIPAVEYLNLKGIQVSHFHFKSTGHNLRKKCWDHYYFDDVMQDMLPPPTATPDTL